MSVPKLLGLLAVALAVVGAFTTVPYSAAILVVLGLVVGQSIEAETHVRVLVSALVLSAFASALNSIPQVGGYLTAFLSGLAVFVSGGALSIVLGNMYRRFKP